jgi:hypothetical protein
VQDRNERNIGSHAMQSLCTFRIAAGIGHATLATKRTLLLTWAGLAPAESRQLCLAPSTYSITSSAIASSDAGTVRLSIVAV